MKIRLSLEDLKDIIREFEEVRKFKKLEQVTYLYVNGQELEVFR